jgi:hypothetical protein
MISMKQSQKEMMLNVIQQFEREARVAKALGNQMEYRQALKKIERAELSMMRWDERYWEV